MMKKLLIMVCAASLLAGCSGRGFNVFKDNKPKESAPAPQVSTEPDLSVTEPVDPRTMSADQIRRTLAGKSWKWSSPRTDGGTIEGLTLFAEDGSSLVEITGRGTTTGKWKAKDGQFCESLAPAPFLPKGLPEKCYAFSGSGNTYKVGKSTFVQS